MFASGLYGALNFIAFSILFHQIQNGTAYLDPCIFHKDGLLQKRYLQYFEQSTQDLILIARGTMHIATAIFLVECGSKPTPKKPFSFSLWDYLGIKEFI